MSDIYRKVMHFFYPNRCPVCSCVIDAMDRFCPECTGRLVKWEGSFTVSGADSFTAAYEYGDSIRPAVALLKSGRMGNAAYAMAMGLADVIRENEMHGRIDSIVPVPMSRESVKRRGYNQAEEICRIISSELEIPMVSAAEKHRTTLEQKELTKKEREVNLRGAFIVPSPELVRGRIILLVDDICTTGSTLAELAGALKNAGAAEVHCACVCKTPAIDNDEVKDNEY